MGRSEGRPVTAADVMTADQVAEIIGVSRRTLLRWAATGAIPSRKYGKAVRFIRWEIEEWLLDGPRGR